MDSRSRLSLTASTLLIAAVAAMVFSPVALAGDDGLAASHIVLDGFSDGAEISGTVYQDWNQDGERDAEEPGLGGATVLVLDMTGTQVAKVLTGQDGAYGIAGLLPGEYIVVEEDPMGYSTLSTGKALVKLGAGHKAEANFGDVLLLAAPSPDDFVEWGTESLELATTEAAF